MKVKIRYEEDGRTVVEYGKNTMLVDAGQLLKLLTKEERRTLLTKYFISQKGTQIDIYESIIKNI